MPRWWGPSPRTRNISLRAGVAPERGVYGRVWFDTRKNIVKRGLGACKGECSYCVASGDRNSTQPMGRAHAHEIARHATKTIRASENDMKAGKGACGKIDQTILPCAEYVSISRRTRRMKPTAEHTLGRRPALGVKAALCIPGKRAFTLCGCG